MPNERMPEKQDGRHRNVTRRAFARLGSSQQRIKTNMKPIKRHWIKAIGICGGGLVVVATALTALSQTAPVLTIAPTGTNQFSITITNGVSTNNYQLYWTPVLANAAYPWALAVIGGAGQTNFTVSSGGYLTGFYRVSVGTDADGDGVPDWQDANPNDPSIGILTVVIDTPTNGMVLQ